MAEEVFLEEFATAQKPIDVDRIELLESSQRLRATERRREGSRYGSSSYGAARSVGVLERLEWEVSGKLP